MPVPNCEKFKHKYRIKSTRLKNWDYSKEGYYFITICTKNKHKFFGQIKFQKIYLNKIGKIAQNCWINIPNHFDFVLLDEFIIMPDHIHGILEINYNDLNPTKKPNISNIIGSFKSACSKSINFKYPALNFNWQPRFWDRIIKTTNELYFTRLYIKENPKKIYNPIPPVEKRHATSLRGNMPHLYRDGNLGKHMKPRTDVFYSGNTKKQLHYGIVENTE